MTSESPRTTNGVSGTTSGDAGDWTLWLASRSPRRVTLLNEAGLEPDVHPAGIDDGELSPGRVTARAWVMALAYLKARATVDQILRANPAAHGVVIGADTVCCHRGAILGQPVDAGHARTMLMSLAGSTHETLTGVCLIDLPAGTRRFIVDVAKVTCGEISPDMIDAYVASGDWQGKAGGYNLVERINAGWPIVCDGDPATVMGLPNEALAADFSRWRAWRDGAGSAEPAA